MYNCKLNNCFSADWRNRSTEAKILKLQIKLLDIFEVALKKPYLVMEIGKKITFKQQNRKWNNTRGKQEHRATKVFLSVPGLCFGNQTTML